MEVMQIGRTLGKCIQMAWVFGLILLLRIQIFLY